jgi:hypothetical protein
MCKTQRRKGIDLLLYNQHIEKLHTMESTFNTKQTAIPCYEQFYRTCMLRCRRIDKDNLDLLERLGKIAKNTHIDDSLGAYVERRIMTKEMEAKEKLRSCSF